MPDPWRPANSELLTVLNASVDAHVAVVVRESERYGSRNPGGSAAPTPRHQARQLRDLVTAWASPGSAYHRDGALLGPIRMLLRAVTAAQHGDGTFTIGNMHSPPDTAFVIDELAVVRSLLRRETLGDSAQFAEAVELVITRCGPPLLHGGVHTPNHRWGLCAALARIDQVAPDPAYRARIDQWLAEGIDQDSDGSYSERSPNYAARVTNPALLTLAWLLDRPDLRAPVRRSLELTLFCADADGEVEAIQSRRQDQDQRMVRLADYYLQLRELAVLEGDTRFVAATRVLDRDGPPAAALSALLDRPELAADLPDPGGRLADSGAAGDWLPDRFTTMFTGCGLARLRRGRTSASVYGGTDEYPQHVPGRSTGARVVGSGLATNPTFLRVSHGAAVLDSVRLATSFFGTGHFRARGLEQLDEASFRLRDEVRAAYYQPLPAAARRANGDYAMEYDGRFFSKLSFGERAGAELALRREVIVREVVEPDSYPRSEATLVLDLDVLVDGVAGVPVTVELSFAPGGQLSGVEPVGGPASEEYLLADGMGHYRHGTDIIEFGPGSGWGVIDMDAGEQYRAHHGSRRPGGVCVYLSGVTPFQHTLRLGCTRQAPA